MDRRRRYPEVGFHVGFRRGASVDDGVVVDESEVLALLLGEWRRGLGDRQAEGLVIKGLQEPR